ncbi:hypothetical protein JCM19239_758 [Vibrio variabilis]|uniref:Uncharacterized protein n=1 Tax=Vibrio variabilis TaxID=990271 RepID=A0ABQ0JKE7_9VIBR|nr:hypothetical protein JCM19239_758 [Vibrio variabilis]
MQWRRFTKLSFFGYIAAQLAYSWAMWGQVNSEFVLWLPALLFCIAIVTFLLLLPRLDSFLMPVALIGFITGSSYVCRRRGVANYPFV